MTLASGADGGLAAAWFEGQRFYGSVLPVNEAERASTPTLRMAEQWLDAYFAGRSAMPPLPPLSPAGSPFRRAVWNLLLQIPPGETTTYGEIARQLRALGLRASAQAVGGAVAHNPISIIIPCHRVWGAGGQVVGYAGGIERKQLLIRHEISHSMGNLLHPPF